MKFNPDDYEVKQVFYTSKDGTKVPMFITHKKGLKLDGNEPDAAVRLRRLQHLADAGLLGQPALPGWRWAASTRSPTCAAAASTARTGTRPARSCKKQNVFDDFIAAAEWLIANKYTRRRTSWPSRAAATAACWSAPCMTQRPDLFGACLPAVGVMDMLRFHKFTAGRFWVDDYGSSDNPEEFKALYAYSPYHNLKPGTKYPATLVTTADTDDRVVPGHSFKFAATLQHCQAGDAPVLIRIETRAGHGAGKPTAKLIEEVADQWAFLVKNLHMKSPGKSSE